MRRDELTNEVERLAFEFFFRFSRFEFALKENGFLGQRDSGDPAKPGWSQFERKFEVDYRPSDAGRALIELAPERQVVSEYGRLKFVAEVFSDRVSNLSQVTRLLRNVRNNLFHGGKHTPVGWENPARICQLLSVSLENLNELAGLGDFEADYNGHY